MTIFPTDVAPAFPLTRHSLLDLGLTDHDITRLARSGDLHRVRWGSYGAPPDGRSPEDRHRDLIHATVDRFRSNSGVFVSHVSAAVLRGAPAWGVDLSRVHLTRPGRAGVSASGSVHPHRGQLQDDEVTVFDGIPVTSPARTALDVSRSCSFTSAVIMVDALLHLELMCADELGALVERATRKGTARGARFVAAFANGLAESAAESHSRVVIARLGLPDPALQVRIKDENGHVIARTDFAMEAFSTVAECDGVSKYIRYLRPGETPAEAVIREKCREDEIRSTGREMVRWIPAELAQPRVIMVRFGRAFARAGFPDWKPGPPRIPLSRR